MTAAFTAFLSLVGFVVALRAAMRNKPRAR
jgi:hypothetical protein